MKRELFKNISVVPSPKGRVVDREGFLSAVLAVYVGTITGDPDKTSLSVKLEHSDTEAGEFSDVLDTMLNPEQATKTGGIPKREVSEEESCIINMDLLGCKKFIKVTPALSFEGGESPKGETICCLVLGDPSASLT